MENENWAYSDRVKEHFINPRNILLDDQEFDYDARGMVGNVMCGDQMVMYIKVDSENLIITDCKWKTYGCASAIASTSVLSEMVKGMTLEKAYTITPKDIVRELGGLPDRKIHCSVLGDKALRAAIDDYYRNHDMEDKVKTVQQSRTICECQQITEEDIEEAVLEGTRTFEQLQEKTKISTGCGKCEPEAREVLKKYIDKYFSD